MNGSTPIKFTILIGAVVAAAVAAGVLIAVFRTPEKPADSAAPSPNTDYRLRFSYTNNTGTPVRVLTLDSPDDGEAEVHYIHLQWLGEYGWESPDTPCWNEPPNCSVLQPGRTYQLLAPKRMNNPLPGTYRIMLSAKSGWVYTEPVMVEMELLVPDVVGLDGVPDAMLK